MAGSASASAGRFSGAVAPVIAGTLVYSLLSFIGPGFTRPQHLRFAEFVDRAQYEAFEGQRCRLFRWGAYKLPDNLFREGNAVLDFERPWVGGAVWCAAAGGAARATSFGAGGATSLVQSVPALTWLGVPLLIVSTIAARNAVARSGGDWQTIKSPQSLAEATAEQLQALQTGAFSLALPLPAHLVENEYEVVAERGLASRVWPEWWEDALQENWLGLGVFAGVYGAARAVELAQGRTLGDVGSRVGGPLWQGVKIVGRGLSWISLLLLVASLGEYGLSYMQIRRALREEQSGHSAAVDAAVALLHRRDERWEWLDRAVAFLHGDEPVGATPKAAESLSELSDDVLVDPMARTSDEDGENSEKRFCSQTNRDSMKLYTVAHPTNSGVFQSWAPLRWRCEEQFLPNQTTRSGWVVQTKKDKWLVWQTPRGHSWALISDEAGEYMLPKKQ